MYVCTVGRCYCVPTVSGRPRWGLLRVRGGIWSLLVSGGEGGGAVCSDDGSVCSVRNGHAVFWMIQRVSWMIRAVSPNDWIGDVKS